MNQEALDNAARELRAAVAAGRFAAVPALLGDYSARVEEAARALTPRDPRFAQLERDCRELLAWARESALAERAHAGARLRETVVARQYGQEREQGHIRDTVG